MSPVQPFSIHEFLGVERRHSILGDKSIYAHARNTWHTHHKYWQRLTNIFWRNRKFENIGQQLWYDKYF